MHRQDGDEHTLYLAAYGKPSRLPINLNRRRDRKSVVDPTEEKKNNEEIRQFDGRLFDGIRGH